MITLIDTRISNLRSIVNAFKVVGADVTIAATPHDLEKASAIVLPGVGVFGEAMKTLDGEGYTDVVRELVLERNVPFLGVCLGMQLLAEEGEEGGRSRGLGVIRGRVVRLRPSSPEFRSPNIGWYGVHRRKPGVLFPETEAEGVQYFVHGYHMRCTDAEDIAATIDYGGQDVVASVERGNVFGCQFHPEKSQDAGLDLLARFVRHVEVEKSSRS